LTRILILDIETSPNIAYVWRFFKENVGAKQVLENTFIMSFAFKWLGEKETWYFSANEYGEINLLKELIDVLDVADIVVAHNGSKFDLPTIQGRALVHGLNPPSPYKVVDTLNVARYEFNFPSNSLEYLAKILGVEEKDNHKNFPGFLLWSECLKNNPKAWDELRTYNIQDVETLEQVYLKMRPWMRRHPNIAVNEEYDRPACPKCGSHHIQLRGFVYTNTYKYRKFQCNDCGGWARTRFNEFPKEKKHALLMNAG
jgi:DNA polymerase III epsilon subunit-like protein